MDRQVKQRLATSLLIEVLDEPRHAQAGNLGNEVGQFQGELIHAQDQDRSYRRFAHARSFADRSSRTGFSVIL